MPLVSVIIPNYNGRAFLEVCLDSLSKQTYRNFDTIVVDDGSTDNSIEYIRNNYENTKIIVNDHNSGFATSVNNGIKNTKSKYIILLNNDTEVKEDFVQKLLDTIERNNKIFSAQAKLVDYNNREQIDDAGDFYNILGWARARGKGQKINSYNKTDYIFASCGGAAIYNRNVLVKIGYFDENFFAYLEDIDIGYRARLHGYINVFAPDAICYHIGSGTSGSRHNAFKVKLAARNSVYLYYKNMMILQLIVNLPFLLCGHVIKYIYFRKKGFEKSYFAGFKEGIKGLKNINRPKFNRKYFLRGIFIQLQIIVNTLRIY